MGLADPEHRAVMEDDAREKGRSLSWVAWRDLTPTVTDAVTTAADAAATSADSADTNTDAAEAPDTNTDAAADSADTDTDAAYTDAVTAAADAAADAATTKSIFAALTKEPDMKRGLKLIQVAGRYGYGVTLVGYQDRTAGDEYTLAPGYVSVSRVSGSRTLGELAADGPKKDHRVAETGGVVEELHRLQIRRALVANEKAWAEYVKKPKGWVEE
jgi:hypothetical protein